MPDTMSRNSPPAATGDRPDPDFWPIERPSARGGLPPGAVGLVDRVREWRSDPRVGVAALLVVAAVAGLVWYRIGLGGGGGQDVTPAPAPAPARAPEPAPGPGGGPAPASSTRAGKVTVHVAGAVTRPGVIELPPGSRVIDAVEAAGGGLTEADLDRMNLAAPLTDGQRVLVQRVGDPPAPADPGAGGTTPVPADGAPTNQPINVNTATQTQLETLPGIGPVLAQAIIAERDRRGGFRSVNELRDVRGIGEKRFADIEALVTV